MTTTTRLFNKVQMLAPSADDKLKWISGLLLVLYHCYDYSPYPPGFSYSFRHRSVTKLIVVCIYFQAVTRAN
jgi:hypothetical protein